MITREEIEHLAALARIELGDEEKKTLQKDVGAILEYVSQIKEVSSGAGIPPFVKPARRLAGGEVSSRSFAAKLRLDGGFSPVNVMREDGEPHESGIYTEKLLSAAPQREGQYIRVKKIL